LAEKRTRKEIVLNDPNALSQARHSKQWILWANRVGYVLAIPALCVIAFAILLILLEIVGATNPVRLTETQRFWWTCGTFGGLFGGIALIGIVSFVEAGERGKAR
jgi:hypothetical protein